MWSLRFLRLGLVPTFCVVPCLALNFSSTTCDVPSSAAFGEPVNISAVVAGNGLGVPTGSVVVSDGGNAIGAAALQADGTAKVTVAFNLGMHEITCNYSGDSAFGPSMSPATMLTVSPATPKIFVTVSQNPVPAGQTLVIDITLVAPGGVPSGGVTLLDGSTVLGVMLLSPNADDSVAQFITKALAPGTHVITVTYDGDANFSPATSQPLVLVIGRQLTSTTILSATSGANGQPIAVRVQVTSNAGTPTGTVTLTEGNRIGAATLGSATLSAGFATILLTGLPLGNHSVVASYGGDDTFDVSSSAPVVVAGTVPITNILLAGTPNPVQAGLTVTLTATVRSPSGNPTGTVTFQGAQSMIGTADLNSAGQATVTTSFPAVGTQVIIASYPGNAQFAASTSAALILTVIPRQLAIVSAASSTAPVAPDSLVSIYGVNLASGTASAALLPWPTILAGVSVVFRDSAGVERLAALKFVSPTQINAVVPPDTPAGPVTVIVRSGTVDVMSGTVMVANTAPGLFAGDGSGKGAAAAIVQVFRADGSVSLQVTFRCDNSGKCTTNAIDLGADGDVPILTLFGTGIRRGGSAVRVLVGTQILTPSYAGPQPQLGGVDQVNVTLPAAALRGAGEVAVAVAIADQVSNTVTVRFQ
ncbi:MAG TPA: Ig-like domain repeat protein [Bryobacteraceae bacterium]|nr:Ig-like domain repeat protein [Bryobacteraceae bacterium]